VDFVIHYKLDTDEESQKELKAFWDMAEWLHAKIKYFNEEYNI